MFSSPVVQGLSFNSGSETHKPRWDCVFIISVASSWFGNPGLGQLAQVLDWWPGMIWAGIDFPSNLRDVLPTTWPLTIQVHHTSLPVVSWTWTCSEGLHMHCFFLLEWLSPHSPMSTLLQVFAQVLPSQWDPLWPSHLKLQPISSSL